MWFTKYNRYIILSNITIAVTSLGFQTTVLYPWHEELSKDIRRLEAKIDKIENPTYNMRIQQNGSK